MMNNWKILDRKDQSKKEWWMVIGAFAAVYFIWGGTYLFNYFAIQAIPPFLMGGSRFFAAGLILYTFLYFRKTAKPTARQWYYSIILGVLFLSIGNGGLVWSMQYIDSGLAALIIAIDPLLIMILLWMIQGVLPGWGGLLGAMLGIIGMYLLLDQPHLNDNPEIWKGFLAISASLVSWAFASIYVSKWDLPVSRMQRAAMQMLAGGSVLLLFSISTGEAQTFSYQLLDLKAILSWLYLVFLGSMLAFSCFNYLMAKVSPEKVATSTYINPLVAVVLGWAFNNEIITSSMLIAGVLMLLGVYFINAVKH